MYVCLVDLVSQCSGDMYDSTALDDLTYNTMYQFAKREAMEQARQVAAKELQG